jgi:hypothetical protein
MPKMVKEVYSGVQYDFSADEGQVAASTTRVFRIIKSDVGEYVNIANECGIQVGNPHPSEEGLYCTSYSAQYEGDSRMVVVATFNYRTTAGGSEDGGAGGGGGADPKSFSPDIRPPNWSVSTSLQEVPAYLWKAITGPDSNKPDFIPCVNPVGDLYEGVTKLAPIITVVVEEFRYINPVQFGTKVGYVNQSGFNIGPLSMEPRTVMFRGVQMRPTVEQWGSMVHRGFVCSFEFAYRPNYVGAPIKENIGWDVLQPQSGFNVYAWQPNSVPDIREEYAQPLDAEDGGRIKEPLALPSGVTVGQKMRAQVRISGLEGKTAQRPSAQPVALNDDGSARSSKSDRQVLVYRYQVQPSMDFAEFALRLT